MMKSIVISLSLLLLASCSLFSETPTSVIEGQRGAYQGILVVEENYIEILKRYEEDTKAAITYHVNYIYEPRINDIRENPDLSREEKSEQIASLERQRQEEIQSAFTEIENNVKEMREQALGNTEILKKLVESVYNYISTTPIQIDNIEFWIEKLNKIKDQQ